MSDPEVLYADLKKKIVDSIQSIFPVEGKKNVLSIQNITVNDISGDNFREQMELKAKGGTLASPVTATVTLTDKETKKIVSQQKMKVGMVPRITPRGSYIIDGNEYQVPHQLLLRPGIFHRIKENGELEAFINVKGFQAKILFDPEKAIFFLSYGTNNIQLLPLLVALGVTEDKMIKAWGKDTYDLMKKNSKSDPNAELAKLNKASNGRSTTDAMAANLWLQSWKLDERVTGKTLQGQKDISTDTLLASSAKLLEINRGHKDQDERDSLEFKSIHGVDDFIKNRFVQNANKIKAKIKSNIDIREDVKQIVSSGLLSDPVHSFFVESSLSNTTEQTNPLNMLGELNKVIITGEGGIENDHAITDQARMAHPSQITFIDPVHTPEKLVGVAQHLAVLSHKEGNDLYTYLYNLKTRKEEKVRVDKLANSVVSFADQFDANRKPKTPKVAASVAGKFGMIDSDKVDYVLFSDKTMFDFATNLAPFLQSNSGNRAAFAGKQLEQALILKHREAPLVQTEMNGGNTFESEIGKGFALTSRSDGVVTKVTKDSIFIGKDEHFFYDHFPLRSKQYLHHTPVVKVGDKVKKGQIIADLNSNEKGKLALGTNLNAAFMSYKGYTFEDGVVLSESGAKKLTSEHMYKEEMDIDPNSILDKKRFFAIYPTEFTAAQMAKLGDDGVIKEGQEVEVGDPLVAHLHKEEYSKEDVILAAFRKSSIKPFKNRSLIWNEEDKGKVLRVIKKAKTIEIQILTEEPMKVGDKLAGRHGNKGIVVKIIPDNEALHTEDGRRIDLYMDPHGIPGRINPSQNIELAASKIAEKTGKPFIVDNFSGRNYLHEILDTHEKLGISDKEYLYDPVSGNKLDEPIQTGKHFTLKLDHPVRKKFSARAQDGYSSDLTPLQGGGVGGQSIDKLTLYSLLAHGANHNLKEMTTYKSEKSDDFWNAYQSGLPLPPPKVPFVFEKFRAMLAASGVNLNKEGSDINLIPVTEKHVKEMSYGEIASPYAVRAKDLAPEKGGLFDTPNPDAWMHIELSEPMPMPMYEEAILALTGLRKADLQDILEHKKFVLANGEISDDDSKGISGGKGLKRILDSIDLDAERIRLTSQAKKAEGSDLDKINRKLHYILNLKKHGISLSDYMTNKIPVIPTKFRQIIQQKNGSLIIPDVNQLYADIIKVNNQLHNIKDLPDSEKANLRKDLYQGMKALIGTGDALTKKGSRDWKGYIKQIAGSSPKFGFYQHKVISKRQDFTGRSTIIPEPEYGLDEIGIPADMAWQIYRPHVIKSLVRLGYKPLDARNAVEQKTDIARRALENEAIERPAIINRSPSLHKFSIMAFHPKIIEGKAIKINPLIVGGFNADFDGDQQIGLVFSLIPNTISSTLGANMTSRYRELIPVNMINSHELVLLNLRDFPHNKVIGVKDHIEFYEASENCYVMSYDEVNRKIIWAKVSGWSKHHDREVEIVNLHNGYQIITDNDPRAVYGCKPGSLVMERFNPENAAKEQVLVPVNVRLTDVNTEIINSIKLEEKYLLKSNNDECFHLKEEIQLTKEFGYLLGVLIGDGWISGHTLKSGDFSPQQINVAGLDDNIFKSFKDSLKSIFKDGIPKETYHEFKKEDNEDRFGDSNRITFSSMRAAKFLLDLIGKGAKNKKLPYFFLNSPREFRLGLLGGLMDTDGSVSVSNGKDKQQLMSNFTTISSNLAFEVQLLMKSLDIKGVISSFNSTLKNTKAFIITISSPDLLKWNYEGMNCERKKIRNIIVDVNSASCASRDIVPISLEVIESVKKFSSKINNSMNTILSKARKEGSISRQAALKIVSDPLFDNNEWKKIIENTDVTWTYVDSYEKTGIKETGYDLTVPGYETFINANGIVLSNTMSVHVPVSEDARKEAFQMMPSNNLFNPQSNSLEHRPSKEQVSGLYMMTLPPLKLAPKKIYSNISELKSDYKSLKVSIRDVVVVNKVVNTVGRHLINDVLPVKYQDKNIVLDKKGLSTLLDGVARKDAKDYGMIVSKLKDLGNMASYSSGLSFGIKDLKLANQSVIKTEFARIERELLKAKDPVKWVSDYAANEMKSSPILKEIHADLEKKQSGLFHLSKSSLGGKLNQIEQILGGPMFVTDHNGKPVPVLIKNSYADGLTASEYWTTMAGTRKGMMDRALETMDTGAFSKEVINSGLYGKVTEKDCGTDEGVLVSLKDKAIHYLDRFTAKGNIGIKANTLVTPEVVKKVKGFIRVRSPLTCKARNQPCAMCFGLKENGQLPSLGDNIGVISAQSLSEPSVQLGMRTFHTGGAVGGNNISGFDRAKQLVELPKIVHDKASLAENSGTVSKISQAPQGGHYISVGGAVHYSPMKPTVKDGDKVVRGDRLSEGNIKPQELAELKGTLEAKSYIVDEVTKLYEDAGRTIRKPLIETAIGQIIRYAQITNPGDSELTVGDYLPVNEIEFQNRTLKKKIEYKEIVKGIGLAPFLSNDFLARLNFERIPEAIQRGAAQGWKSELHGTHPIPGYAFGAEFGQVPTAGAKLPEKKIEMPILFKKK